MTEDLSVALRDMSFIVLNRTGALGNLGFGDNRHV